MTMKQAFFNAKTHDVNDFFAKSPKDRKNCKENFFTKLLTKQSKNS